MDYIRFGSTGLKVSPLAFGMVFRAQSDQAKALETVEAAKLIAASISSTVPIPMGRPTTGHWALGDLSGFWQKRLKASEIV